MNFGKLTKRNRKNGTLNKGENWSLPPRTNERKVFIILPSKKNLTKKIFKHYKNHSIEKKNQLNSQNNLTSSSMALNKEFRELFIYLFNHRKDFIKFGMSGSGSSIFVSFKKITKERLIFGEINKFYPSVRIEKSLYFG